MIIVFEGHDGVGKTSVINSVKRLLQLNGKNVTIVKNPSKIYKNVRDGIKNNLSASFYFSYSASMFALYEAEYMKRLGYNIILMDRYYYSTLVSHMSRGFHVDMNYFDVFLKPDLVFWLKVSEETRCERLFGRKENLEHDMLTLNKDLIKKADEFYSSFGLIEIDNERELDIVAKDVYSIITKTINNPLLL